MCCFSRDLNARTSGTFLYLQTLLYVPVKPTLYTLKTYVLLLTGPDRADLRHVLYLQTLLYIPLKPTLRTLKPYVLLQNLCRRRVEAQHVGFKGV